MNEKFEILQDGSLKCLKGEFFVWVEYREGSIPSPILGVKITSVLPSSFVPSNALVEEILDSR